MEEMLVVFVFVLISMLMVGGFILMFPVTRRLGAFLEAWLRERNTAASAAEVAALKRVVAELQAEVRTLRERQTFAEQMLGRRESAALPGPRSGED